MRSRRPAARSRQRPAAAASTVTVPTGCTWTATSSASWLTVTSGASGTGNGTVGYAATANTGPTRSANLTVGGQTFMVTQANGCTYAASPTSVSAAAGRGSGSVAVTAGTGCTWTASSSASWLTVTSGASGSGNGSVGYSIAANTGAARSATLTSAARPSPCRRQHWSCNYTFAPTSASFTAAAGSSSVAVTAPTGCAWTASQQRVVAHRHLRRLRQRQRHGRLRGGRQHRAARSANLTIGGQTYAVTQAQRLHVRRSRRPASRRRGRGQRHRRRHRRHRLHVDRDQQRVVADRHFRRVRLRQRQRRLFGRRQHRCRALGDADRRRQDGQRLASQAALLSHTTRSRRPAPRSPPRAGSSSVAVTVPTGCTWTATSSASWLTVTSGASGNGNGTVGSPPPPTPAPPGRARSPWAAKP